MLSKISRSAMLRGRALTKVRAFSSEVAVPETETHSNVALSEDYHDRVHAVRTAQATDLRKLGDQMREDHKDFLESEKDYLAMLSDASARHRFFSAIAEHDSRDHPELSKVKSKIS